MALARLFPDLERSMRDTEWDDPAASVRLPAAPGAAADLPAAALGPADRRTGQPRARRPARRDPEDLPRIPGDAATVAWLEHVWPAVKRALDHLWTAHDPGADRRDRGRATEHLRHLDLRRQHASSARSTSRRCARSRRWPPARGETISPPNAARSSSAAGSRSSAALERRVLRPGGRFRRASGAELGDRLPQRPACSASGGRTCSGSAICSIRSASAPPPIAIVDHNFRRELRGAPTGAARLRHRRRPGAADLHLAARRAPGGADAVFGRSLDRDGVRGRRAAACRRASRSARCSIVEAVRARYDGRKQNPWNDIECGDHYVRAMASWSLLEAASGYVYDAGTATIGFAPVIGPEDFRAPFVGHEGWGTVAQTVRDGRQTLIADTGLRRAHALDAADAPADLRFAMQRCARRYAAGNPNRWFRP